MARPVAFRYALDPVCLGSLAVYVVNRALIKPHLHPYSPFFHGHLDDMLLVPVALPVFLLVYRLLGLRPDNAPPRWWEIVSHLAVWSIFFKWFGPVVLHRSVADPVDLACYAGGGLAAWILWHLPRRTSHQLNPPPIAPSATLADTPPA